jgi:hypothetical protein
MDQGLGEGSNDVILPICTPRSRVPGEDADASSG